MATVKIENTQVFGFAAALRGMRNPMDSWDKSDSYTTENIANLVSYENNIEHFYLGEADKTLSQKLSKAGAEHRKHLRQIQVWTNWTLPRFIWQEADTYHHIEKISCSTMHTLMKNPITTDMFDDEKVLPSVFTNLNSARNECLVAKENKDSERTNKLLQEAKLILPESFLQMRSINTNYECLLNMYHQRKSHRLPHWHILCDWILELPYFCDLTGI